MDLVFKYEEQLLQISMIQMQNLQSNFMWNLNVNFH
jgi:hypothetical protein